MATIELSWLNGEIERLISELRQIQAVALDQQSSEKTLGDLPDPVLEKSIEELALSVRSYNCLVAANIRNIGRLVQCTEAELLKEKYLGKKSLSEIKEVLESMGYGLGMVVKAGRAIRCCSECGRLRY